MRVLTPELVYHNIQPIYAVDIQPVTEDFTRLATGGLDAVVRLWRLSTEIPQISTKTVELVATLDRHERDVNAVRWSPSGKKLASASGDGVIILWERKEDKYEKNNELGDEETYSEVWTPHFLRRHIQDVYDICWSGDDNHIISGSIDCSAILWNIKNNKSLLLKDHKQFVQGVAWDPLDNFVVTQSADRTFRVYRSSSRNCIYKVWKAGDVKLFQDGSWKYFFRRLQFSPDGKLLVTPAGVYNAKKENTNNDLTSLLMNNEEHCAHIFVRNNLSKVAVTIPTGKSPVIGVRFNPIRFTLRKIEQSVFKLPYRWIFCLILESGVLIFDTEQSLPIAKITNIHCLSLNDASWSSNGHCLVVCSTDGYCSYIYFDKGELGEPFMLACKQIMSKPLEFENNDNTSIVPIVSEVVNQCLDSTEILPIEVDDSSDTDCCSIEQAQDEVMDQDLPDKECEIIPPPISSDQPIKRRLTFKTLTDNDIIPEKFVDVEVHIEEPKEKKRRLTFTTLT